MVTLADSHNLIDVGGQVVLRNSQIVSKICIKSRSDNLSFLLYENLSVLMKFLIMESTSPEHSELISLNAFNTNDQNSDRLRDDSKGKRVNSLNINYHPK
jgi:hypothetical protein